MRCGVKYLQAALAVCFQQRDFRRSSNSVPKPTTPRHHTNKSFSVMLLLLLLLLLLMMMMMTKTRDDNTMQDDDAKRCHSHSHNCIFNCRPAYSVNEAQYDGGGGAGEEAEHAQDGGGDVGEAEGLKLGEHHGFVPGGV